MNEKDQARQMFMRFMEMSLKHSKINVPQPMPIIEEKAKKNLSTDGIISFNMILKEWEKVSPEDKKAIAKLLMLNSHDIVEIIESRTSLLDETKDTPEFVEKHPEYGREDCLDRKSIMEELDSFLGG